MESIADENTYCIPSKSIYYSKSLEWDNELLQDFKIYLYYLYLVSSFVHLHLHVPGHNQTNEDVTLQ